MAKRKKKAAKKKVAKKKTKRKAPKNKPNARVSRPKRDKGGRLLPGQTANAAGRPRADMDVRAAAREQTQAAIDTLTRALRCHSPAVRVKAAVALLDRGWGRPAQTLEHTGPDGGPIQTALDFSGLTDDELAELRRLALKGGGSDPGM